MSTRRLLTRCNGRITSPTFELVLYVFWACVQSSFCWAVFRSGTGQGTAGMSAMPSGFGKWGPNAVKTTAGPRPLQRELPEPTTWGNTALDWTSPEPKGS